MNQISGFDIFTSKNLTRELQCDTVSLTRWHNPVGLPYIRGLSVLFRISNNGDFYLFPSHHKIDLYSGFLYVLKLLLIPDFKKLEIEKK